MHVLNNFLAFGLALAFSDMASTLNPTGGSWWSIPVTLTQSLVYLGLVILVGRRMGLDDHDRRAPRFGGAAEPACKVSRRSVTALRALRRQGRKAVSHWDMV